MARWRGRCLPGLPLGLLLVAGCTASPPLDDASSSGTSAEVTSSPATETVTDPATETSGGGTTRSQVGDPAVTVPQLPIGGAGQDGEFEQCVSVSYRGERTPIPDGVRIEVTGVSLDPPLLEVGGPGCSAGEDLCLAGFAFVAGDDPGTCSVPVQGTGPRPEEDDEDAHDQQVTLSVAGLVTCPEGQDALCDDFADRVAADDQTIGLAIRLSESTETTETTTETTSETSATSETSESSAETTEEPAPTEDAGTPTD